jgi:steroid delta-isomerase-like uncharacterized protein
MSAEQNKHIVRRIFAQVWSQGDESAIPELVAEDHAFYLPGAPVAAGLEGYRQVLRLYRTAYPDLVLTAEDLIAEGDTVATRYTGTGTHHGELQGIAPTGKPVTVPGITLNRLRDGKITETRVEFDQLGMLQQIGVVPPPGS